MSNGSGGLRRVRTATAARMRADAQRNRARILEAAEVVFAAEGIEVPVDAIAEKAGVGVGTLYRHFPTKEKLCEAILLEPPGRRSPSTPGRWPTRRTRLRHSSASSSTSPRSCRQAGPDRRGHGRGHGVRAGGRRGEGRALIDAVGVLLQRAQAVGAVRPDVTADHGGQPRRGHLPGGHRTRDGSPVGELLDIVCDGLRSQDAAR